MVFFFFLNINHVLKFNYQPSHLKVNCWFRFQNWAAQSEPRNVCTAVPYPV